MPEATRPLRNLLLADAVIDRDALRRDEPGLLEALTGDPRTRVLELRGEAAPVVTLGITAGDDLTPVSGVALVWRAPLEADRAWIDDGGLALYLGRVEGRPALALLGPPAADASREAADEENAVDEQRARWTTLREVGPELDAGDVASFTSALALSQWHAAHTHCPRCGEPTAVRQAGWVRVCPTDGSQHFPRTDPAVIMAVVDGEPSDPTSRILLARGTRWEGAHRSVLAGFVEPGESFEQAVARETFEESGVEVSDVRYLGSQPWPFPASVMVGFVARAVTTELVAQEGEIEEIGWYARADVERGLAAGTLRLPGRLSIARALIEHWYGGPLPDSDAAVAAAPTTP